ncbi:MAG: T9SS type A sorting domain-containing protein [Flavobacteriales bacterium]|nr:T9SS type A sorting domain-containing protein [Flavobacteriales bacterium]
MKKNIYKAFFGTGVLAAGLVAWHFAPSSKMTYQPKDGEKTAESFEGAAEYLNSLRANQITGIVDPEIVNGVKQQVIAFESKFGKAKFPFSWRFAGPDNVGGRTRALLVDRNNSSILFAGGVNGGIFKSTNKGASWYAVDDQMIDMAISSICQTPNGTIYVGTGEAFTTGFSGEESGSPGFSGGGIYKSTDGGTTFAKIASTSGYSYVNKVFSHPTKNIVFAATSNGLRASDESDDTKWNVVLSGVVTDIVLDKNGNALAVSGPKVYRSTDPTTNGSYTAVTGLPLSGISRMVVAHAPSDPNYAYVVVTGIISINGPRGVINVGSGLKGVYQSKDNGQNFEQIIGQGSTFFDPWTHLSLGFSQGSYDLCLAVHPFDREHIYMGGVDFAEWTPNKGPYVVGNTNDHKANPFGIHADKHLIVFDTVSKPAIMYITSDGGISRTTTSTFDRYTTLYNGYSATQYYGIAAGRNGLIIGGSQDNNTVVINGRGNTPQSAIEVLGGDGFQCEVSMINPDVVFGESQNTGMARSFNAGGNMSPIWDERIKEECVDVRSDGTVVQASNIFNSPMALWERLSDSASKLYIGMNDAVWMALNASTAPSPIWYKVAALSFPPANFEIVPDGGSLFLSGRTSNTLYRIDGFNREVEWDTAIIGATDISDSLELVSIFGTGLPSGRSVTDIEVDQSNPNRVIVTLGNYGNTAFVYVTENAMDASPVWRNITGGLPGFPVYDAEISVDNNNVIILGTEYGIYYTQNGNATNPTWTFNKDSMPRVAVFQIRQVEEKVFKNGSRTGAMLYAGTHGRGIWKSSSALTKVNSISREATLSLLAYPNPATDAVTVKMALRSNDALTIEVMSMTGQIMMSKKMNATGTQAVIDLDVSSLRSGNYIISVKGSNHTAATKFIKQ